MANQPLIPGTSYRHGTCINVCGHDFVLTDDTEFLQEYTSPTAHLTVVNSSHKGSVFLAPDNDMAKGLIQFSLCPNAKSVVPHYWMLSSLFEEQQAKLRDSRAEQQFQEQGRPYAKPEEVHGWCNAPSYEQKPNQYAGQQQQCRFSPPRQQQPPQYGNHGGFQRY